MISSRSPHALLVGLLLVVASVFPLSAFAIGDNMTGDNLAGQQQRQDAQRQEAAREAARNVQLAPQSNAPEVTQFVPQLSVPIPGVNFTPPTPEGDQISVPFLAQYITGIYSYMLGISTIIAIIVVIVGGFYYLLGATVGDAKKGQTLIKDAIGGLVVLYASYFILYTINPNLVSLRPLKLLRIQSVPLGEGSGIDAVTSGSPSNSVSCPLRYNQGVGPWASLRYGNNRDILTSGSMTEPRCANAAQGTADATCITSFQQSGCGVTSLASVLGFYGLEIAIPSRVPAPSAAMHRIDPIDTGIYSVLNGGRRKNNGPGPTGTFFGSIEQYFPQFSEQTVSGPAVIQKLREGKPIIIGCSHVRLYSDDAATQPVVGARGNTDLYDGHFMVLSGVVNDQILRIHDVGNGHSKTIRVEDFQARCHGSGRLITPKPSAPAEATATWGTGNAQVTVQMRLNAQGDHQTCAQSGGAAPTTGSRRSGELDIVSFNYQPAGSSPDAWPANSARALFPARLRSEQNPRVHAFIYLHGNNDHNKTPEEGNYLRLLRESLERVAGSKNIVILTPHHLRAGNNYNRFQLQAFYDQALTAVRTVLPNITVTDVAVGAHSGATCQGLPGFRQALSWGGPSLRGVIAYDGCLGDVLTPSNFSVPSGVAFYLSPNITGEMGGVPVRGNQTRNELVQRLWRLTPLTGSDKPACASEAGVAVDVYAPQANLQRQGGGELVSFATRSDHATNVRAMTNIAFCALYRNNP